MNNKGFTLVELLAVMVILLAISVVAVTNVTASLKRNENQEIATQKKIAINAAKIYFSMEGGSYVQIKTLIDGKYPGQEKNVKYIKEASSIDKLKTSDYVVICSNIVGYKVQDSSSTTCQ